MYDSKLTSWSCYEIKQMIDNKQIDLDSKMQRGYVWQLAKKNLLIDSILRGIPIPQIVSSKGDADGVYEIVDGKQRLTTIYNYMSDEFKLKNLSPVEYSVGSEVKVCELEGKRFSELPIDLQKKIENKVIDGFFYDSMTENEKGELFYRINNGKSLTNIELSWSKAESGDEIMQLAKHEIFKRALKKTDIEKSIHKDIVIKSYIVLYMEKPSFETKLIKKVITEIQFTDDEIDELNNIYDKILDACDLMKGTRVTRRVFKKTHLVSLVPVIKKAIDEGKSDEEVKEFLEDFFGEPKRTTISDVYNKNAAGAGTGKRPAVKARLNELDKYYKKYFNKIETGEIQ